MKQEYSHQIVVVVGTAESIWRRIMSDKYNPKYYKNYSIQVTDAIESWGLSFVQGNIIKYIVRAGKKTADPFDDLNKALWYLERELSKYGRQEEKDSSQYDKQNRKTKLKAKSTSTLSRKSRNLAKSNGGVRITTQAF
jgi:hypothetical protein